MTTNKAAEALLAHWDTWLAYGHWTDCAVWADPMENDCTCEFTPEWLREQVAAIITEATDQQAAEVERLRSTAALAEALRERAR